MFHTSAVFPTMFAGHTLFAKCLGRRNLFGETQRAAPGVPACTPALLSLEMIDCLVDGLIWAAPPQVKLKIWRPWRWSVSSCQSFYENVQSLMFLAPKWLTRWYEQSQILWWKTVRPHEHSSRSGIAACHMPIDCLDCFNMFYHVLTPCSNHSSFAIWRLHVQ